MSASSETPRAVTRFTGSAATRASPQGVWSVIADPARLPEWFSGARDVEASADYPAAGATLAWRVGRWRFRARVVDSQAPSLLRQEVDTPSATSLVTHRVVSRDGEVRYEKEVEARWKGWLERALAGAFVAWSVRKETERVARLAERHG